MINALINPFEGEGKRQRYEGPISSAWFMEDGEPKFNAQLWDRHGVELGMLTVRYASVIELQRPRIRQWGQVYAEFTTAEDQPEGRIGKLSLLIFPESYDLLLKEVFFSELPEGE